jgi:hypothetical protein
MVIVALAIVRALSSGVGTKSPSYTPSYSPGYSYPTLPPADTPWGSPGATSPEAIHRMLEEVRKKQRDPFARPDFAPPPPKNLQVPPTAPEPPRP